MTSYQVQAHVGRQIHPSWADASSSASNGNGSAAAAAAAHPTTADRSTAATSARPASSSSSSAAPSVAQSTTTALGAAGGTPIPSEYDASCAFCRIVKGQGQGYIVWEDEQTIAFLDLMPIRPGHTLLIPKSHCPRISDLDPRTGACIGSAIPQITKAITKATGNDDLNVVLNQGYAQAVFHAHFHLIPAPSAAPPSVPRSSKPSSRSTRKVADWTAAELQQSPPSHREMLRGETDARSGYLSERDGLDMSQRIRSFL